jgi:RNA polymerase sigma-70 factor, ECF subfamily
MVPDENDLILRAQEGNAMAFEQLIRQYDRQVLSIASSFTRNSEDAKDIYQEVFLRVYRAIKTFRFQSKFSTWLHRIATNVCLTYRSQRKDHLYDSLDENWDDPEGKQHSLPYALVNHQSPDRNTLDLEISEHVNKALDTLSPQQKLVFSLRHYEGYKLREIADMLNCAEGTVKKYLFTATEKLRGQLRDLIE